MRPTRCWATAGLRSPRCCRGGELPAGARTSQGIPWPLWGSKAQSGFSGVVDFPQKRSPSDSCLGRCRDLAAERGWGRAAWGAPVYCAGAHLVALSASCPGHGCMRAQSLKSCPDSFATPWTVARQVSLSMEFSRQEYWSGLPCPSPGDLPNPGIRPMSLGFPALAGKFFTTSDT